MGGSMADPTRRQRADLVWESYDPALLAWPTWLIDGLIPERSTICLYGGSNVGKTFLALDWALSIATGEPWLDMKTKAECGKEKTPGKVAYLLAEGPDGLIRRTLGWLSHKKVETEKGAELLQDRFLLPRGEVFLDRQADLDRLIANIEEKCKDLSLLVLDPLASFMAGDENSTRDMQVVVEALRKIVAKFGCSVLLVHHSGKNEWAGERGSSALRSGVDTLLCLFQYAKSKDIALEVEKQRDAAKHPDIPLDFLPIFEPDGEGRQLGLIPIKGVPRWKKAEGTAQGATETPAEGGMPTAPSRTEQKARRICARIAQLLNEPNAPADGYVHFDDIYQAFEHETARGFGKTAIGEDLALLVKRKIVLQRKGKRLYTLPKAKENRSAEDADQALEETPES